MKDDKSKKIVQKLLKYADIKINGNKPWDIKVHKKEFYKRVLAQGSLGLGESYMDGWWDVKKLDEFFNRVLSAKIDEKVIPLSLKLKIVKSKIFNIQTKERSKKVAKEHYDLIPKLYESFLDPYNQYTCGYWKKAKKLNEAQEAKLHLICKKLQITPKDKVLDIGCGWGGFAKFASKHYKCHVTGITISDEQFKYAKKYCRGLPIKIMKLDYRDLKGKYDKILICGMIEHVGYKNYRTVMEIVNKTLKENGLFLLHTIGGNKSSTTTDPWMEKYIFPNGMLPSIKQIGKSIEGLFVMEDWHNFGADYDKTLMAWFKNFNRNWPNLKKTGKYDDRFYRMWKYYLLSIAGNFRTRYNQLWQIVLSKKGVPKGYNSIR